MNVRTGSASQAERPFSREETSLWGRYSRYVRGDTFDAHMRRLETKMDAMNDRLETKIDGLKGEMKSVNDCLETEIDGLKGEMKSMNDRLLVEIGSVRTELRGDIKLLDGKIYALEGKLSQNLVITSIITTIFGIIITALQFLK